MKWISVFMILLIPVSVEAVSDYRTFGAHSVGSPALASEVLLLASSPSAAAPFVVASRATKPQILPAGVAEAARVKTLQAPAWIQREGKTFDARLEERIYAGDVLKTGAQGTMGIVFRDNTVLSLGPNSTISVREFLFEPAEGKLSLITRMLRGTASYITGIIARLSPQAVRFETPVAHVGIRGTSILVKIEEEEAP